MFILEVHIFKNILRILSYPSTEVKVSQIVTAKPSQQASFHRHSKDDSHFLSLLYFYILFIYLFFLLSLQCNFFNCAREKSH